MSTLVSRLAVFARLAVLTSSVAVLSACTTLPPAQDTLYSGLSQADINKSFPDGQGRSAADPVCVSFYANAQAYQSQVKPNGKGARFFTSVGLATLAGVAGAAVGGAGIGSTVGQIAANQAASTAAYQGGALVVSGLKPSSQAARHIASTAEQLGCPVVIT